MRSFVGSHLGEALQWRAGVPIERRSIMVAALGMIVPVLLGLALGRAEIGFTIGLGAMLLAGGPAAEEPASVAERASAGSAIAPALLAVTMATAIAGHAGSDAAMILLATIAAAISGYSRPVGVAAIRFIIYFVLSLSLLASAGDHRGAAALLFGAGALWNVAVRALLRRPGTTLVGAAETSDRPAPTSAQRRAHWRRTMRAVSGWQYPIRLAVGLGLASILRSAWPAHHYGWIVVTVALLTQRPLEHVPIKITQRAIGTVLGVALSAAIFATAPPIPLLALLIVLFATAAPIARARSYLAYAAIATPAILLVMDLGRPIVAGLLIDRLVATLAGAAIVVAANLAADRWIPKPAPRPVRRARMPAEVPGGERAQSSVGVSSAPASSVSPPAAGRS